MKKQTNQYVQLHGVSKKFRKDMRSFRDLIEYILGISSPRDFWAIQDVSMHLKPGDTVGLTGKNGAGKSTLLKLIAGITKATKGTLKTRGRIGPLIELGAGFQHELTGRENIFLYGAILGMSHKEIKERFQSIVDFSELGDWLETPIKFYSSGMFIRLGFAITVMSDPDILIVDEALSVGDLPFQQKCLAKIDEFKKANKIILIVSHDMELLREHVQTILYLEHGAIVRTEAIA